MPSDENIWKDNTIECFNDNVEECEDFLDEYAPDLLLMQQILCNETAIFDLIVRYRDEIPYATYDTVIQNIEERLERKGMVEDLINSKSESLAFICQTLISYDGWQNNNRSRSCIANLTGMKHNDYECVKYAMLNSDSNAAASSNTNNLALWITAAHLLQYNSLGRGVYNLCSYVADKGVKCTKYAINKLAP